MVEGTRARKKFVRSGGNENGGRRGEKLNASMVVLMQDGQFHIR